MAEELKSLSMIDAIDSTALERDIVDITQKLISENPTSSTQELMDLFNYNMKKKNILRLYKLSELENYVLEAMIERMRKRPGELTHDDLLRYITTLESSMDRTQKSINNTETISAPVINVQNNTNVKLNVFEGAGALTSESKAHVVDAIKAYLNQAVNSKDETVEEEDYIDMTADVETKGEN